MALTRNSLLLQAKRGNEESWRHLTDLYRPLLQNWLKYREIPPQDVDDLLQEILLSVVKSLPAFEHNGNRGAFRRWLRTISLNRVNDYRRANRVAAPSAVAEHPLELGLDGVAEPDSELERLWDQEHDHYILSCVVELVRHQFEPTTFLAFRRQALDGADPTQVAKETGLSVAAVYAAKSRVLRVVREKAAGLID